jgi:hypothetical protein
VSKLPTTQEQKAAKAVADAARWASYSPEQRADKARKDRERWANCTPEHRAERVQKKREYDRNMTQEKAAEYARNKRKSKLKRKYGLTLDDFENILTEQGGGCSICKAVPERPLDIDHCHTTGHVRGLLCNKCNTGLGLFGDSPERLEAAAKYLRYDKLKQQGAAANGS